MKSLFRTSINPVWTRIRGIRASVHDALLPYPIGFVQAAVKASSELLENGFIKQLDRNEQPILVRFVDADWQRTQRNCMSALSATLKNVRV